MKHGAELLSKIVPKDGRTPLEKLTGDTIDISEYLDFDFMIRFGIGIHLVEKRGRLCLKYGSGFHTELTQAYATGY